MVRRKVRDADDARSCLARVAASRKARAEWARENGIDPRSLNAWRLILARGSRSSSGPRLVELVAEPLPPVSTRYTVRIGDLAVEVDDSFDDDVLRRLVRVVASC